MSKIYLDYAATTPVDPLVREAMLPYLGEYFGNPSSVHSCGQKARSGIEKARSQVANLIGARPEEIVFTSGGTEADNMALEGVAYALKTRGNHIITSSIEHHAVLECCHFLESQGFKVTYLPVGRNGRVNPDDFEKAIQPGTILISIMLANNEVGTIEPLEEIVSVAKKHGIYCHTDAVQAAGNIPVDVNALGVDLLSMSAHKLYGPKGVGALYIRQGTKLVPFLHGGGQERGRRASTENLSGIAGFGKAAELAQARMADEVKRVTALRDRLYEGIINQITGIQLNGDPVNRLPGNLNVSVGGAAGEAMLLKLDVAGICVSTGSACNSENPDPSHVLRALGLTIPQADNSLRLTLGKPTTRQEVDTAVKTLADVVAELRAEPPVFPAPKTVSQGKSVRFKGDAIVIFPDVAASIKGANILKASGIENKLVAPPPQMRMGCDLGLEIYVTDQPKIEKLFVEKAVPTLYFLPLKQEG
jgi:cysteine desulfurase